MKSSAQGTLQDFHKFGGAAGRVGRQRLRATAR
jgi:hypothetical protein